MKTGRPTKSDRQSREIERVSGKVNVSVSEKDKQRGMRNKKNC